MPQGYWSVDHANSDTDPHWLFRQRGFKKLCGWSVPGGVALQTTPAGIPYDLDAEALDRLIERLTERRDQLRREAEAARTVHFVPHAILLPAGAQEIPEKAVNHATQGDEGRAEGAA